MSGWSAKRFWKSATVEPCEGGFTVKLDGRAVKTPAKAALVLPTQAMAEAVAAEWQAQGAKIDPTTMPVTRSANAALDKVRAQQAEVAALIAAYGETDLLCYRAKMPEELVARQAAAWDRWLDWADSRYQARLTVTAGVLPVAQPEQAQAALASRVAACDIWELAALHDLVGITGSLVLGLAVAEGEIAAEEAWRLSRIDEDWQIAQWGADEEAAEMAALKREALIHAGRFWILRHTA
ncbi:ATP12 family chaperone protein [Rhodobacter capsulatus]|jgi:chaperone required for assembly of F1-ATPase|uniref:ATP12 chaperone protein family n=1 Tax=Rhodobacter capsulatus (strain ATCC BAA-309 / NBRC 16581 / SB1003) TaxID=272942 RepID=D5AM29_RHOCB|nr:ATP12 family protein [Rhodobacter capsulatus]ADE84099.1 ATP12 chaperone protein family [Rhodobacter capsulatus SB 1003]ETD03207.1 ATPase [Rhodobacter capsulatus DE442]ETD79476.1 ATPase [Rhodobacter capsulatus R121]ETE55266.1 ATPase [Rhodobacter capsulatus Y262]MDS0925694.1 ATPase [Rhodobacter capsulatus]